MIITMVNMILAKSLLVINDDFCCDGMEGWTDDMGNGGLGSILKLIVVLILIEIVVGGMLW